MKKLVIVAISTFLFLNIAYGERPEDSGVVIGIDSAQEQKEAEKMQKELERAERRARRRNARLQRQIKRTQKRAKKKTTRLERKIEKTDKKLRRQTENLESDMQEQREELVERIRENDQLADCNISNDFQSITCPDGKVYRLSASENELPRFFRRGQQEDIEPSILQEDDSVETLDR